MFKKTIFLFFILLLFFACSDKKRDDVKNNIFFNSTYSNLWYVYDQGVFNLVNYSINYYVQNIDSYIDFKYNTDSIKMSWDGSVGIHYFTKAPSTYYGFYVSFKDHRNLQAYNFNKIVFQIKGSLGSNYLVLYGPNSKSELSVSNNDINTESYNSFSVSIDNSYMNNVDFVFGIIIKSTKFYNQNTDGAYIYIKNIKFIKE